MAKPEWGIKRTCQSCAAVFYDLKRSPISCPKCGAQFDPEAVLKSRRGRPVPAEEEPRTPLDSTGNCAANLPQSLLVDYSSKIRIVLHSHLQLFNFLQKEF